MNMLEQVREQCAKVAAAWGYSVLVDAILAIKLPEFPQEPLTTPNTYGGFAAGFFVANNRRPPRRKP